VTQRLLSLRLLVMIDELMRRMTEMEVFCGTDSLVEVRLVAAVHGTRDGGSMVGPRTCRVALVIALFDGQRRTVVVKVWRQSGGAEA